MNPSAAHTGLVSGVPAPGVPSVEVGIATDPGREPTKQVNEDAGAARHTAHGHLAVVCDGMGGHVGGREASHLAIETIFNTFDTTPTNVPPQQVLGDALRHANAAVWSLGQSSAELRGMGSTVVAVLTHPGGTDVAHVGDSRVYLLTQGQMYQVTKDHSLVQKLVDANMLTPEQAANHPNANQITNALGQRPDIDVEVRPQPLPLMAGDTFLLCSDGLSDECGMHDFLQILAPHPPCAEAARQLVDLANQRGGHDNITVILVRLPGGRPFAPPPSPNSPGYGPSTTLPTAEMDVLPTTAFGHGGPMGAAAHGLGGVAPTPPMGVPGPPPAMAMPVPPPPITPGPPPAMAMTGPPPMNPLPAPAPGALGPGGTSPSLGVVPSSYAPPPPFDPPPPFSETRGSGLKIVIVLSVLLVLGGGGFAWWWFTQRVPISPPALPTNDDTNGDSTEVPAPAPSAKPRLAKPPTEPRDLPSGATPAPSGSTAPAPHPSHPTNRPSAPTKLAPPASSIPSDFAK